jgi:phosphotransferase system enzyme I (PtsP)
MPPCAMWQPVTACGERITVMVNAGLREDMPNVR